jgi:hypothetical protein
MIWTWTPGIHELLDEQDASAPERSGGQSEHDEYIRIKALEVLWRLNVGNQPTPGQQKEMLRFLAPQIEHYIRTGQVPEA